MKIITEVTLNMDRPTVGIKVYAKQWDKDTRVVYATLLAKGEPYTIPEGVKVFVYIKKPDCRFCYNECAVEDGKVVIELTNQALAAAGTAYAEIRLERQGENSAGITSARFHIEIEASFRKERAILSSNEVTAFDKKFGEYEAAIKAAEKSIAAYQSELEALHAALTSAEAERQEAEKNRDSEESERAQAELLRAEAVKNAIENAETATSAANSAASDARSAASEVALTVETMKQNEENRASAEAERREAETARELAENARKTAETLRIEAETERASAEILRIEAEKARATAEEGRKTAETERENVFQAAKEQTEAATDAALAAAKTMSLEDRDEQKFYTYRLFVRDGFPHMEFEEIEEETA